MAGNIEVTISPRDLYTHGAVKTAVAARLHEWVTESGLGTVFVDSTRIVDPQVGLSAEPDIVVALDETLDRGDLREVPSVSHEAGRYVELEGAPDLVVEILSDSSVAKDTERLPPLYAAAGIPELWLIDARTDRLAFEVKALEGAIYKPVEGASDGWTLSPLLGRVRLSRERNRRSRWRYRLERLS